MKFRMGHRNTFTLILLMSLRGLALHAGAQVSSFNRRGSSPELRTTNGQGQKEIANSASGYTYTVLHSFCAESDCVDGDGPLAPLILDAAGNLFGTTYTGGAIWGGGTMFKVDITGRETVLHSFCSRGGDNCTDGWTPNAGLFMDATGRLYGTTYGGGVNGIFDGTVFQVDKKGHERVIYNFCSVGRWCTDGLAPAASLIQDTAGNLYGTTQYGGIGSCEAGLDYFGCGTVFKLEGKKKQQTVLYSFKGAPDGAGPVAGLTIDKKSNLFGITSGGGGGYVGTVFRVDSKGHERLLHTFCPQRGESCPDGSYPSGLIRDTTGILYGTTVGGGANNGGTIFKLDKRGRETVLYNFCSEGGSACTDGRWPNGLIRDDAGNLYGTTYGGGANTAANDGVGGGTVFKLDSSGHETVLYSFCSEGGSNCTDGVTPLVGVIRDDAGNLYGTTYLGGANYYYAGTVFKLAPVPARQPD